MVVAMVVDVDVVVVVVVVVDTTALVTLETHSAGKPPNRSTWSNEVSGASTSGAAQARNGFKKGTQEEEPTQST